MKLLALLVSGVVATSSLVLGGGTGVVMEDSPATYEVDGVHSSVVFGVQHAGVSRFYGRFNKMAGQFSFSESDPTKARFEIEVDADSVDTASDGRDKHLKSPDFFSVKQFPKITFKSKSLEKSGDAWKLKGDLTLHGVTKLIEADFEWIGVGEMQGTKKGGFEATFKFKRSDFGMSNHLGGIGDDVKVIVSLEGNQK